MAHIYIPVSLYSLRGAVMHRCSEHLGVNIHIYIYIYFFFPRNKIFWVLRVLGVFGFMYCGIL